MSFIADIAAVFTVMLAIAFAVWMVTQLFKGNEA